MQKVLILTICCFTPFCFGDANWLEHVQNRIDEDAVAWLREKISESVKDSQKQSLDKLMDEQCKTCFSEGILEMAPRILVFMSFSVPDESWIQLSKELEKQDGVFVLRGLPANSFQVYAKKIMHLKNKGLSVEVQINPQLFKQYEVADVPTIVLLNGDKEEYTKVEVYPGSDDVEKITGNISLRYALEKFKQHKGSSKKKPKIASFPHTLSSIDRPKKKIMGMLS